MLTALIIVALMAPAHSAVPTIPAVISQTDAETCHILETAYSTAILNSADNGVPNLIHPNTVVAAEHELVKLETWIPEARRRLSITDDELGNLELLQKTTSPRYIPNCAWEGAAKDYKTSPPYTASFSMPLIDKKSRLAMVEVSFYSPGRFAFGKACILRKLKRDWVTKCDMSWIT